VESTVTTRLDPVTDPATSTTVTASKSTGFTDEERAALRERAHEQQAAARRGPRAGKADGVSAVRAKIAAMPEADKEQGIWRQSVLKLHCLRSAHGPFSGCLRVQARSFHHEA
jgi:hypothetical protein